VDPEQLAAGEALLRGAGFRTHRRDDLLASKDYLAGDDARRAGEFMELVADTRVDGIVCARGGYGCDRILHRLDPDAVRAAAKPLIGFSDITALLLWQRRRAGLMALHGPMLNLGSDLDPDAFAWLVAQLTGEAAVPGALRRAGRSIRGGRSCCSRTAASGPTGSIACCSSFAGREGSIGWRGSASAISRAASTSASRRVRRSR
jgi:muramoyltetrapeptide carboxypeptidase